MQGVKLGGFLTGARNVSAMPNAPSSSIPVRKAPQPRKPHTYVAAMIGDDGGRLSILTADTAKPFVAKKLDAASRRLQKRAEAKLHRDQQRDYRLMEKGLRIEFIEAEAARRRWGRVIRTRVRPEPICYQPPKSRKRDWPYAKRALPRYGGIVLDRMGARGVFMRIRYYSRKTASAGVSSRLVKYVFDGAEVDASGRPYFLSNVGQDVTETLCAFDHLEQVNWAAQRNAKLLMHAIMAVDYRQTPDQMMRTGMLWAEEALGRFNLPFAVTLHAPPDEGDARNWHLHILFSFRPLARTGDHAWQVGDMLRTDLDNAQAMGLMRDMFAATMTLTSFESGINQTYTSQSNAARGLVHEPQEHLGGMLTSMVRDGHHIARNEENFERVMRSQAAQIDEDLRHADEALAREQQLAHSLRRRFAKLPVVAPLLRSLALQRITTAMRPAQIADIAMPMRPVAAPIAMAALKPPVRTLATTLATVGAVPVPARPVSTGIGAGQMPAMAQAAIRSALPARPVANLRLPLPPAAFAGKAMPSMLAPMACRTVVPASMPSSVPLPLRRVADDGLHLVLERIDQALATDARREADRMEAERTQQAAAMLAAQDAQRRQAIARLIAQIIAERRAVEKRHGKRRVEPDLLARHDLTEADIEADAVQAELERIAQARAAEVDRIARIGREAAAVMASAEAPSEPLPSPPDLPAPEPHIPDQVAEKPRGPSLTAWARAARQADRMVATDEEDDWPQRSHKNAAPAIEQQADTVSPDRPSLSPQGPAL